VSSPRGSEAPLAQRAVKAENVIKKQELDIHLFPSKGNGGKELEGSMFRIKSLSLTYSTKSILVFKHSRTYHIRV